MESVKALTVVAALVLVLAGCTRASDVAAGSSSPAETVAAFMHALGDKNADAACAQVSTGGQPLTNAGYDQCKEGLQKVDPDLRYVGFRIPPVFVVGYGLDVDERWRNLPYVCEYAEPDV